MQALHDSPPSAAATPAPGRAAVLHRLLDAALRLPPEYADGLSSHLPMALAALHGLGADEARLRAFFATYAVRFDGAPPPPAAPPVPAGADWTTLLGRFEAFEALRAHFGAALARQGRDAVLAGNLPVLLLGVGAVAFHGLIRTAHAVESDHVPELAAALAYWASRWLPLEAPAEVAPGFDGAAEWLAALDARRLAADPGWSPAGRLIVDRMREATRTTAYRELAGRRIERPLAALGDLARAAAARYAQTRNFTVLHLATGARAARVLAPWLPRGEAALAPLWHAVAAASLASGAAALPRRPLEAEPLTWLEVRARARASDDDHVIKLVHAMSSQVAFEPDPVWLAAARVAVSR
jgi:hypothetical protein